MHLLTQFTPHPPAAAPVHQSGMHPVASLLSRDEENPPPAAALRNDSVRKLVVLAYREVLSMLRDSNLECQCLNNDL